MTETPRDDYDTPWKDIVTHAFPEFMAFYFPAAAAGIDWSCGYEFLDQELAQVVRDAELGRRLLDKLVRVATYDGQERRGIHPHRDPRPARRRLRRAPVRL